MNEPRMPVERDYTNMTSEFCWIAVLCFLLLGTQIAKGNADPVTTTSANLSRTEFAVRMARVTDGMAKSDVTRLLGAPDAIRSEFERTRWCYGVVPESGFPTLGVVGFDRAGVVDLISGGAGIPPNESQISEAKLRRLMDAIGVLQVDSKTSTADWPVTRDFDPGRCIATVNTFVAEGQTTALLAVDEYERVAEDRAPNLGNADVLLRILFDPPIGGSMRPTAEATYSSGNPINVDSIPRFPIVMVDDVPILSVDSAYGLGIYTRHDQRDFLANIHRFAHMRTTPIKPPANPLLIFEKLSASEQWYWSDKCKKLRPWNSEPDFAKNGREDAKRQLLRLVRPVYPATSDFLEGFAAMQPISEAAWQKCCADVERLHLQWDLKTNQYQIQTGESGIEEPAKSDISSQTPAADSPDPEVDRVANLLADMPDWISVGPPKTAPLDEILAYGKKISTASTETIRKAELLYLERLPKGTFDDDLLNKFFVLHRYIFNVPAWAPFRTIPFFGGFAGVPTTHDSFSSLWPLSYDKNKQLLLTGQFRGYYGGPYVATDEFDFFAKTFGRRQKPGHGKSRSIPGASS